MNLSDIKEGPLKDVFDALEEAFEKNDIDFYLIGAQARDQWYAKDNLVARQTTQLNFEPFISKKIVSLLFASMTEINEIPADNDLL